MKKIYEDKDVLIVDTEDENLAFPIYVFYETKIIHANYDFKTSAFPSMIETIIYNEIQKYVKSVKNN